MCLRLVGVSYNFAIAHETRGVESDRTYFVRITDINGIFEQSKIFRKSLIDYDIDIIQVRRSLASVCSFLLTNLCRNLWLVGNAYRMQMERRRKLENGHTVKVTAVGSVSLHHASLHHHHPHICKNSAIHPRHGFVNVTSKWMNIIYTGGRM